jgi:hypothetical protein
MDSLQTSSETGSNYPSEVLFSFPLNESDKRQILLTNESLDNNGGDL